MSNPIHIPETDISNVCLVCYCLYKWEYNGIYITGLCVCVQGMTYPAYELWCLGRIPTAAGHPPVEHHPFSFHKHSTQRIRVMHSFHPIPSSRYSPNFR